VGIAYKKEDDLKVGAVDRPKLGLGWLRCTTDTLYACSVVVGGVCYCRDCGVGSAIGGMGLWGPEGLTLHELSCMYVYQALACFLEPCVLVVSTASMHSMFPGYIETPDPQGHADLAGCFYHIVSR
jgi:hypothetical protein